MSHVITTYFRITKSKERFAIDSKRLEEGTYEHKPVAPISKVFKDYKEETVGDRKESELNLNFSAYEWYFNRIAFSYTFTL